ncbi:MULTISPECIES: glycosyltransferase family 1 protein [unclassified Arthrobacter]|uniref:glycosyltransferase family 1 protein n=1 Tax=unclassified Arthrobacter TaxID=235627 RepID=UPI001492EC72|nr:MULTISPECIES: glycosyltransferase family 1 protein [unclassified Arthrobacter]MBE0008659.1 glycosyltransferase family 1 protein [Arthrobacter sp. AET 35A]NOJ62492.1 glycosyltransferase family 1 protein [Arthrobacter sp. 147(2020)]
MTEGNLPGARPRILVLSFSPIHRDPRVLRQIQFFSEFADVMSCGYGAAPEGVVDHVEIPVEYKPWRPDFKKVAVLLGARFHERLYFDSDRVKHVLKNIPAGSVDVIVANDALAVPAAVALRPRKGIHADLHEYAPRQGEDKLQWKLLVGPLMDWACRKYVTKADSVSTVAKGIAEEYAAVYRIPEPAVVPNASYYDDRYSPSPVHSPLRLIHAGAAGRGRKIEIMMDAVARANELKPGSVTFDVVLVPGEQDYIDELAVKAAAVPGGVIRMLPPVKFEEIVGLLHGYDIGFYLCPPANFNMLHALPNKLFEFVQARLAVLIGPSPEMKRVVEEHGFGVVSKDFDAESAAQVLIGLTPEQVAEMKEASHKAARTLSAENVAAPWIAAVKKLAGVA